MYESDSEKSGLNYLWLAISLVISLTIVVVANLLHQSLFVIVWGVLLFVVAAITSKLICNCLGRFIVCCCSN